jgi:hypothetical protein
MEDTSNVPQEPDRVGGPGVADIGGRPRIEFDLTQLENLGAISATQPEVAAWFRVSLSIIEKRLADEETRYAHNGHVLTFREVYEMGIGRGKMSLRRAQMDLALGGNATMQIWLGKQLLGQRDHMDTVLSGDLAITKRLIGVNVDDV